MRGAWVVHPIVDNLDPDRFKMKNSQTANDSLHPADANIDRRITFARDTLRSIQQLIQLLDQKSYLILVITGVTSTAFFSIVGAYIGRLQHRVDSTLIVPVMSAWFLIEAGLILWFALKSIQGDIGKPVVIEAPGMIFPHGILSRYDAQRYYDTLTALSDDEILCDYSAEILKTSNIFCVKSQQVDKAVKALYRSMIPWMISIAATFYFRVV